MSAEEGEGSPSPPATAAEDPSPAEEAAPATKSDIESIRSKVDGELADAKTKTWQNIKMRTKMSILQVNAKIRFVHPQPTAFGSGLFSGRGASLGGVCPIGGGPQGARSKRRQGNNNAFFSIQSYRPRRGAERTAKRLAAAHIRR